MPKKSLLKSIFPASVFGRLAKSRVDTRNIWPAPSASAAVMIGVLTQKKPSSWKKRWIAWAAWWRTRVTAPKVLVRGRRWACSRRYSSECSLGWSG